jgi:predicted nucleotidyltransferase
MIPDEAQVAIETWLAQHDRLAPGLVEGLYLVGSLALDDWQPRSDIDVVVFTADPATDEDAERLEAAHQAVASELDRTVDGPRLAWGDVSVPPTPLHRPWSLDGAFHHDAECFEINPVTWYTLATSGVSIRGPGRTGLHVVIDLDDRRAFVRGNTATYWRSVADMVAQALADAERTEFSAETTEWCVLGIARMFVTYRTGDVVSKSAAGAFLAAEAPEYESLVERSLEIRRAPVAPDPVDRATVAGVSELLERVIETIAG